MKIEYEQRRQEEVDRQKIKNEFMKKQMKSTFERRAASLQQQKKADAVELKH